MDPLALGGPQTGSVFERFSAEARDAVLEGRRSAQNHGHFYISSEHLLLGIALGGETPGAQLLARKGLGRVALEQAVLARNAQGDHETERLPFTPRAKRVLELALREALRMDEKQIECWHLLLALLSEEEGGAAAEILAPAGLSRAEIIALSGRIIEPGHPWLEPAFAPEPSSPLEQARRMVARAELELADARAELERLEREDPAG